MKMERGRKRSVGSLLYLRRRSSDFDSALNKMREAGWPFHWELPTSTPPAILPGESEPTLQRLKLVLCPHFRRPAEAGFQTGCKSIVIEKGNSVNASLGNVLCAAACAAILLIAPSVGAQAAKSQPAIGHLPSAAAWTSASFLHNANTRYMRAEIKALLLPAERVAAEACHVDGAACSDSSECCGTCEGGSCCTAAGKTCDSSSHCCGHVSCKDGTCP